MTMIEYHTFFGGGYWCARCVYGPNGKRSRCVCVWLAKSTKNRKRKQSKRNPVSGSMIATRLQTFLSLSYNIFFVSVVSVVFHLHRINWILLLIFTMTHISDGVFLNVARAYNFEPDVVPSIWLMPLNMHFKWSIEAIFTSKM